VISGQRTVNGGVRECVRRGKRGNVGRRPGRRELGVEGPGFSGAKSACRSRWLKAVLFFPQRRGGAEGSFIEAIHTPGDAGRPDLGHRLQQPRPPDPAGRTTGTNRPRWSRGSSARGRTRSPSTGGRPGGPKAFSLPCAVPVEARSGPHSAVHGSSPPRPPRSRSGSPSSSVPCASARVIFLSGSNRRAGALGACAADAVWVLAGGAALRRSSASRSEGPPGQ